MTASLRGRPAVALGLPEGGDEVTQPLLLRFAGQGAVADLPRPAHLDTAAHCEGRRVGRLGAHPLVEASGYRGAVSRRQRVDRDPYPVEPVVRAGQSGRQRRPKRPYVTASGGVTHRRQFRSAKGDVETSHGGALQPDAGRCERPMITHHPPAVTTTPVSAPQSRWSLISCPLGALAGPWLRASMKETTRTGDEVGDDVHQHRDAQEHTYVGREPGLRSSLP
ncbi:hypothetical protein [Dactylosporangium sp. NPDC048998]|uniref:hypothetical protein n=1 Tax=Dactylosporangium sp. NPDC048998 TaxID=3363976 RepID=UPI003714B123